MPAPTSAAIADAVASQLQAATLPLAFSVQRTYVPQYQPEETTATLTVSVTAGAFRRRRLNRTQHVYEYDVEVGVQKEIDGHAVADVDPLVEFVEQLVESLTDDLGVVAGEEVIRDREEVLAIPYDAHLDEGVFTAVVRITYQLVR